MIRLTVAAAIGAILGAFVGGVATGIILWIRPVPRPAADGMDTFTRGDVGDLWGTSSIGQTWSADPLDVTPRDAP